MIGEIRDLETASYAVQAALTGHLVFSTLVLAALVAPEIFLQDGRFCFSLHNIFLLSAVLCFVVGKLCGSFFGAVFTGIGCVALLRWFGM